MESSYMLCRRLANTIALLLACLSTTVAMGQAASEGSPAAPSEPPLVVEAREILAEIDRLAADASELRARGQAAEDGEDKAVAELQAHRRMVDWMRAVDRLVDNVVKQKEQDLEASAFVQKTRKLLLRLDRRIPAFMDETMEKAAELRRDLADATPDAAVALESRIREFEEILDEAVRFALIHVEHMDRLELGSSRARAAATEKLQRRAGDLSARLELANQRLDRIRERIHENLASAEEQAALGDAQEAFDHIAASLWTTCDVMDELGLPTAEHRQALILATGELTTDVLDAEVVGGLFEDAIERCQRWLEQRGPILIGRSTIFLFVMIAFWILGRIIRAILSRLLEPSGAQTSELARRMIVGTASRLVLAIGFFVALSQVGVNVTALLAGLGIVGFIIGFALQETLGNFAAGAMILMYQPFDVGDVIEAAGVHGTVDNMNLVSTTILTFDNQTLVVPNSRIWGNVIRNATALESRRVDLTFPLAVDVDVPAAEAVFESMCRDHPAVLDEPEPAIRVHEVKGDGVVFVVRPWVKTTDYWATFWDLNREALIRLSTAGIRIATSRYELETPAVRDSL